jgi:drug/metabolite transporter superfamily protein YnfA
VRFLRSFGKFWYDFVIGDDWKIAAAVVLALTALLVATVLGAFGDAGLAIFGGITIVLAFTTSLAIDVRRST